MTIIQITLKTLKLGRKTQQSRQVLILPYGIVSPCIKACMEIVKPHIQLHLPSDPKAPTGTLLVLIDAAAWAKTLSRGSLSV